MANKDLILRHLNFVYPSEATISDLERATGVTPHSQVFKITNELRLKGIILGRTIANKWYFKANPMTETTSKPQSGALTAEEESMNSSIFEQMARDVFSNFFAIDLRIGSLPGVPKKWDMLSRDGRIVGDAKYYTLVGGTSLPPAKFATIAEHVWLLEKTQAEIKILVFGHQIEVPRLWLARYGALVHDVTFYFLDEDGVISQLN